LPLKPLKSVYIVIHASFLEKKCLIFRGLSFIRHKLYTRIPNTSRAHYKDQLVNAIGEIMGMFFENCTEHINVLCGKIQGLCGRPVSS